MPSDERIARLLLETRTIALVGASMKPGRASFRVGNYLASVGYRVIGVNTGHVGKTLFGQPIVRSLSDIQEDVQLVDIFRKSERVLPDVEEALASLNGLRGIWMQLDIRNAEARNLAESKGLTVIEDRCTAIEHRRLLGRSKSA
ncbi:MAG: CoA-binding protein [Boseongicola sp.]|nr:CoA-binding protein [Boseongicola sp.]NNL18742.1 CoA-binding protein [Boseongicola sp.]